MSHSEPRSDSILTSTATSTSNPIIIYFDFVEITFFEVEVEVHTIVSKISQSLQCLRQ